MSVEVCLREEPGEEGTQRRKERVGSRACQEMGTYARQGLQEFLSLPGMW